MRATFSWFPIWRRALLPAPLLGLWMLIVLALAMFGSARFPVGYTDGRIITFAGAALGAWATFALPPRGHLWPHHRWQHVGWLMFLYLLCAIPGEYLQTNDAALGQFTVTWALTVACARLIPPATAALPVFMLVFGIGILHGSLVFHNPRAWYTGSWLVGAPNEANLPAIAACCLVGTLALYGWRGRR